MKRINAVLIFLFICFIGLLISSATQTEAASSTTYFQVGTGYVDVIPHQIVRTADDRVYIFAGLAQFSNIVAVYWTTQPGFPASKSDFAGSTQISLAADPISVDAVYDGSRFIHVITNDQSGKLLDHPFDTTTNTFRAVQTLAVNVPTVGGAGYIGSGGESGMFDKNGLLHVAYWIVGNHIFYANYVYNAVTDTLTVNSAPIQIDPGGRLFRHPSLVVSPVDNSLAVAWTAPKLGSPQTPPQDAPGDIFIRQRASNGTWGTTTTVNTAPAWTSTAFGIDIDQGPQMVVTLDGVYHLVYQQYYANGQDYGHVHYVVQSGAVWIDTPIAFYSHDPALATTGTNALMILGHGHPLNVSCQSKRQNICVVTQNPNGTWSNPQVFATATGNDDFDSSPSVKWSAVGWTRPDVIEFLFFSAVKSNYNTTNVWYARIGLGGPLPTLLPPTASPKRSSTPDPNNQKQSPDPHILKQSDVSLARPGDKVTFTITVTNTGTAPATGVTITDTIPDPLQFVSVHAGQYSTIVNRNTVLFNLGTVTPGQNIVLTVITQVRSDAKPPIDVTNTAVLSDDQGQVQEASASLRITAGILPNTGEHPDGP